MANNKVNYGLCRLYYSIITDNGESFAYGVPVAMPGAVNFSAEPKGEATEFEADNIVLYRSGGSEGYTITLTIANVPDEFITDVLGQTADSKKVVFENIRDSAKKIAILGQFDGDVHAKRWVFFNCTPERYNWESETSMKKNPKTITLTLAADPDYNGDVKASTTADTDKAAYDGWFGAVYTKSAG